MGISESTKSDLDSLLREVKKEQGTTEEPIASGSGGVFSQVVPQVLPVGCKHLSRDPTLDALLQQELKGRDEKSHSRYQKLQVGMWTCGVHSNIIVACILCLSKPVCLN